MDVKLRDRFLAGWTKYFPDVELPIVFFYTDAADRGKLLRTPNRHRCLICDLGRVRRGASVSFAHDTVGCLGGKRYLGFSQALRPEFPYFLSCGIPGKIKGERYKKSPELVTEQMKHQLPFSAPARYIVFKRWDRLEEVDDPLAAIFFAAPDVLAALFTLANFDEARSDAVITPFCAGCAAIVHYPYHQLATEHPRAILGMFDISARPCVPADRLTFAIPWPKFLRMIADMEASFLTTASWGKVKRRLQKSPTI